MSAIVPTFDVDQLAAAMVNHQTLEPDFDDGGRSWICECGVRVHTGRQVDAWGPLARHQVTVLRDAAAKAST